MGGAAAAAIAPAPWLVPAAVAGSAVALALVPGGSRKRLVVATLCAAAGAIPSQWALPIGAALLGWIMADVGGARPVPGRAVTMFLCAGAAVIAMYTLP